MDVRVNRNQGVRKIVEHVKEYSQFILDEPIMDEYADATILLDEEDVIKASYNIIDLIEAGDYVNGHKILGNNNYKIFYYECYDGEIGLEDIDIKSIVTKEQFNKVKYELGDEINDNI